MNSRVVGTLISLLIRVKQQQQHLLAVGLSDYDRRIFSLTEASFGWLKVWHVGPEGRDYNWARDRVLECLQGKRQPLVTRPLPPEFEALAAPAVAKAPGKQDPNEKIDPREEDPDEMAAREAQAKGLNPPDATQPQPPAPKPPPPQPKHK